jgi:type II secretory pathway component PulJ
MTTATTPPWEEKRTAEIRMVEEYLKQHFRQADVYRYNSASIRVRVVDPRFEGIPRDQRDAMVEQYLDQLPPETQRDVVTLLTSAPSELERTPATFKEYMLNTEFDAPQPHRCFDRWARRFVAIGIGFNVVASSVVRF